MRNFTKKEPPAPPPPEKQERKKPGPKPGPFHDIPRSQRRKARAEMEAKAKAEAAAERLRLARIRAARKALDALRGGATHREAQQANGFPNWDSFNRALKSDPELEAAYEEWRADRAEGDALEEDEILRQTAIGQRPNNFLTAKGQVVSMCSVNLEILQRRHELRNPVKPDEGDAGDYLSILKRVTAGDADAAAEA